MLLMTARGFSASGVGALIALVALVTLVLELPTGGLADVAGRRVVLVAASSIMALGFMCAGTSSRHSVIVFGLVLFAVGRALSSGPLVSWYVDEVNAIVPADRRDDAITHGLSRSTTALSIALAVGSVSGGWLSALGVSLGLPARGDAPVIGLSVPFLLAAALMAADVLALVRWMHEPPRSRSSMSELAASVPATVRSGIVLVSGQPLLRWFFLRWAIVPVGFLAFELLSPIRLGKLLADPADAAGIFGVVTALAYGGQSVSASAANWLARRVGRVRASAGLTMSTGVAFAAAGAGRIGGLVAAVLIAMVVSGPVNALNGPIVHGAVGPEHRTTLLSIESLTTQIAVAAGAIVLGATARATGTGAAFAVAGSITALGALPMVGVAFAQRSATRTLRQPA
ncbi:MAG: hypothetical protein R2715_07280 [Ilumatobacteraceae bacterium]